MCAQSSVATAAILVDDLALAQALHFMLTSEGFEAQVCRDGAEVLVLNLPIEKVCLIVDERVQGGSGVAALSALRADGVEAPAILIATAPDAAFHQAARDAHAEVVEKPLVGDALLAAVRALTQA